MGKYGWRRITEEQGWDIVLHQLEDGFWTGALCRTGFVGPSFQAWDQEAVIEQLEAWWRAQVTA